MDKIKNLENVDNIVDIIKSATNLDLDISGSWGYDKQNATIINSTDKYDIDGFELLLITIRTNIQMNITLPEEKRYVSISPTLISQKVIKDGDQVYHFNTYKIEAVKEMDFTRLSKEYKENYGKEDFDITDHFKQRENSKISTETNYWFKV